MDWILDDTVSVCGGGQVATKGRKERGVTYGEMTEEGTQFGLESYSLREGSIGVGESTNFMSDIRLLRVRI